MGANGIYGLSGSGLDIESLVKMGMMKKQNQYDKMYQQQVQQTWQKEAYNDVYTKVNNFKNATSAFKLQSNMNAMKATSSNSDVVSVSANGAAAAMSHKVAVSSVASNAYIMTGMDASGNAHTIDRVNTTTPGSTSLKDVLYKSVQAYTRDDGTKGYKVTMADDSVREVSATDTAISLNLQDSTEVDSDGNPTIYNVSYTFEDLVDGKKTLQDFASAMSRSGANIQGGYDAANDSFSFYNKTSGEKNIVGLSAANDDTARLLDSFHLASYDTATNALTNLSAFSVDTQQKAVGTNAKVTVDGKNYDLDTNVKTIAGVTYTFNGVTEPGKTSTVNVTQDTSTIVDNVKKFVESYNELIDDLNSKLNEEKNSDYKPLTESQKKEMKEDQITKWEEKAKSGLLRHDSTVRSLVSAMRESIYTPVDAVDSKYNSLSAIGITTTGVQGHITLNEDKLNKALAEDPDCVYQLFASDQDSTYIEGSTNKNTITNSQRKLDYSNTGVANRLYNVMTDYASKISDLAGTTKDADDQSYLGKSITNLTSKMDLFKTQMTAYEKTLYKKYDAMEVALSKMGAQLGYLGIE